MPSEQFSDEKPILLDPVLGGLKGRSEVLSFGAVKGPFRVALGGSGDDRVRCEGPRGSAGAEGTLVEGATWWRTWPGCMWLCCGFVCFPTVVSAKLRCKGLVLFFSLSLYIYFSFQNPISK